MVRLARSRPRDAPQAPRIRLSPEERRQRILDAAVEQFAERGYEGASISEIARGAGVVASVIYDHFPSKRALHVQLLEIHGSALIERAVRPVEGATPQDLLRWSIEAFFEFMEEDPFVWRLLFRDPPSDPEIARAHKRIQDRATEAIAALIEAAMPGAEPQWGIPRRQASWMLAEAARAVTDALAAWWYEHPEVPREQVVTVAVALLWEGFGGIVDSAR
jgi:AcrR family transcriptional regulator